MDIGDAFEDAVSAVVTFVPRFIAFLLILIIGYVTARILAKVLDKILERVGFDSAVERGGVGWALARSRYDASDILSKLLFYAVMLFVLSAAVSALGPNPVSGYLQSVVAYLPLVFVAFLIIVVAAAIAAAVRTLIQNSLGGLAYGRLLGNAGGSTYGQGAHRL